MSHSLISPAGPQISQGKVKVRYAWICIAPCREHTSKALRYGARSHVRYTESSFSISFARHTLSRDVILTVERSHRSGHSALQSSVAKCVITNELD